MKNSEILPVLMFDYETMSREQIIAASQHLPCKMLRWLGAHHPDNQTRRIFFELTNVDIGEGTVINLNFVVSDGYKPLLKIGKRVAVSPNVTVICDSSPNNSCLQEEVYVRSRLIVANPVVIEDDVWIGSNVVILPGVTLGQGAIIGSGAVVTRSVTPWTIAVGIPAREIRTLRKRVEHG